MVWPLICAFLSLGFEPVHFMCVVRTLRKSVICTEASLINTCTSCWWASVKRLQPFLDNLMGLVSHSPKLQNPIQNHCWTYLLVKMPPDLRIWWAYFLRHHIKTALNPAGRKHSTTKLKVSLRVLCYSYFVYMLNKNIRRATYKLLCPFNATFNYHFNPARHDNLTGRHEPNGCVAA